MTGLFVGGGSRRLTLGNQRDSAGEQAIRSSAEVGRQNEAISNDVEKLFMITEALWTILKKHHGYTDENLGKMIQDIDLRDGILDGRVAKQQNPDCPKCGRTLLGKHSVCLYCGAGVARNLFER